MSGTVEEVVREAGFTDAAEFYRMVASVDLTKPGILVRFKHWQNDDGSKHGLEELLCG